MSSDSKKFIKGIGSGYAFTGFNLLVSLWLVPFVLGYLTKPEYGIFAIVTDLLGWLSLTSLGVGATFNVQGGQLLGRKDFEELNIVASTAFFSQLASTIFVLFFGALLVWKPYLLLGTVERTENLQLLLVLLVFGYAISFIVQPLSALLIASKQIHIDNYLRFGLLAVKTILTVVFLVNGLKLLSLALSSLLATILISVITWIRVKRSLPQVKIKVSLFRRDRLGYLLKNGIWFTIGGLAGLFIFKIDSLLIGKYISLEMVAGFVITSKLYQIADMFHQQFFNTTRPYFAQVYGQGNLKLLGKMYDLSFALSFSAAFLLGFIMFIINRWFIGMWVGKEFYLGDTVNMFICINFILQAAVLPNRIVLAASLYKNNVHALSRLAEGLLKLILCVVFIQYYGINAILIGGIIASLLFSTTFLNYLSSKLLGENFFAKLKPFAFIILIPFLGFIENLFVQIILSIIVVFGIVFYTYFKINQNKEILYPIYARILTKCNKKNN